MSWRLLAARRFLPLFATQFLGAFNDNLFRSAMLFLIAFRLLAGQPERAAFAATLTGGLFILPFLLFSSLSGQIADRIDKAWIARTVKYAEVAIMLVGAVGLLLPSLPLLYLVLLAMGTHSTVFGPVKYAILPQHLADDELVAGTGLVEAATFLAILAGQIAGGLLPAPMAAAAMLAVALAGVVAARFVPAAPSPDGGVPIDWNIARGTITIVRHAGTNRALLHGIVGISWFFALGATLTQEFVPLVAELGAPPRAAVLLFALFSFGVALGSLGVVRWMRGRVTTRPILPAALAIVVLTIALGLTLGRVPPGVPAGVAAWAFAAELVALAIAGGAYAVPLYATLQTAGDPAARARDIAANNVVNALAMVAVTLVAGAALGAGIGLPGLFVALGVLGLGAVWSAARLERDR